MFDGVRPSRFEGTRCDGVNNLPHRFPIDFPNPQRLRNPQVPSQLPHRSAATSPLSASSESSTPENPQKIPVQTLTPQPSAQHPRTLSTQHSQPLSKSQSPTLHSALSQQSKASSTCFLNSSPQLSALVSTASQHSALRSPPTTQHSLP